MDRRFPTPAHAVARDLRKAGIRAKASACGTIIRLWDLGGDDAAALRMLYPAVQKFTLRTEIESKTNAS